MQSPQPRGWLSGGRQFADGSACAVGSTQSCCLSQQHSPGLVIGAHCPGIAAEELVIRWLLFMALLWRQGKRQVANVGASEKVW